MYVIKIKVFYNIKYSSFTGLLIPDTSFLENILGQYFKQAVIISYKINHDVFNDDTFPLEIEAIGTEMRGGFNPTNIGSLIRSFLGRALHHERPIVRFEKD